MTELNETNRLLLCTTNRENYNPHNVQSILAYALQLKGKTFEDILVQNGLNEAQIDFLREKSMSNKGMLGILLEEAWFGYPVNGRQEADFSEVGVELKSTPYEGEGDKIRPGETLSLTQIDYTVPQESDFRHSHAYEKLKKILVVYYKREKERAKKSGSKLIYSIDYVFMVEPDEKDLKIMEADYNLLVHEYIMTGNADKLSRSHGLYLGVAPKSRRKEEVIQYYSNQEGLNEKALKRGFVLKIPYLTYLLQRAAGIKEDDSGTIITDISELYEKTMAEIISDRVKEFVDSDIEDIWKRKKNKDEGNLPEAKQMAAILICRMLGVSNNRVEEFVKAGILPKTIIFRKNKSDNQHFRLEDIDFMDLYNEESDEEANKEMLEENKLEDIKDDDDFIVMRRGWEASKLYSYLADRQYLFMVFWETDNGYIFKGCQLWEMPEEDIERVHTVWSKTKETIKQGVQFNIVTTKDGKNIVYNNLPGISDNGIFHIRNHANHSFYVIDKKTYGSGEMSDTDLLPDGNYITKQAYWLNRTYVEKQLRPELVMEYKKKKEQ